MITKNDNKNIKNNDLFFFLLYVIIMMSKPSTRNTLKRSNSQQLTGLELENLRLRIENERLLKIIKEYKEEEKQPMIDYDYEIEHIVSDVKKDITTKYEDKIKTYELDAEKLFNECDERLNTLSKIITSYATNAMSRNFHITKTRLAKKIIKTAKLLKTMEAFYNKYTIYIYVEFLTNHIENINAFTNGEDLLEYSRTSDSRNSQIIYIDTTLYEIIEVFIKLHEDRIYTLTEVIYQHEESEGLQMLICEIIEYLFTSEELTTLFN